MIASVCSTTGAHVLVQLFGVYKVNHAQEGHDAIVSRLKSGGSEHHDRLSDSRGKVARLDIMLMACETKDI